MQRTHRLCLARDLSEHDIVARVMRRENYLVGMVNKVGAGNGPRGYGLIQREGGMQMQGCLRLRFGHCEGCRGACKPIVCSAGPQHAGSISLLRHRPHTHTHTFARPPTPRCYPQGVLALNVPIPGLRRHFLLTKTLEWNLYWCAAWDPLLHKAVGCRIKLPTPSVTISPSPSLPPLPQVHPGRHV